MFTCFILFLKVIEILLVYTFNFGIKLCPKLPKYLTVEVRNIHIVIRGGMRGHGGRYGSSDVVAIGTWEGKIR